MRASKKSLIISIRAACSNCLRRVVRPFGFVVIPIEEINWIEQDGIDYYHAMKKPNVGIKDRAYFNGLADYASKKSKQLRDKYLP